MKMKCDSKGTFSFFMMQPAQTIDLLSFGFIT